MATGCQGVRDAARLSGGAAVSSQSPNMKPPSGKSSTTPARSENAVNQLAILDHWSSRSWASPCRWYSTTAPRSPHHPNPPRPAAGATPAAGRRERDENRYHAVVVRLLGGQVSEPGAEHAGGVVQVGRGGREYLKVAGPAQTFVPLRGIGGHVDEVAPACPR